MLEQAEKQWLKPLSDYSFSELVDLKKSQFDSVLENDESNIGFLTNVKKMMSMEYDQIAVQVKALSSMASDSETDEETKSKCLNTIKGMYAILFSLEYKACAITEKIKKLTV